MSPKLQPVRGTHDILPDDFEKFHAVVTRARELATLYGFREMATPIFEMTDVFARSMGETSDVVSKEMFTFNTKGEESVTLRPEFTAGTVRAFISNGMQQHLPLKLFSTGPVFRYERPQKGRQRQFHQVNYEWLGDASPEADVEIILLAGQLLYSLSGEKCVLHINTLGDPESRAHYRDALVNYLTPYTNQLSEDSQRRLVSNPLRILDSKSPQDKKILEDAPYITHYLNDQARQRFDTVCKALNLDVAPFFQHVKIDPSLVRGLDYYTDTVFEFVAETGELGAQNTVLAGGRYDGLVEYMDGKPTPAIGFAAGVERLLLLAQNDEKAELENFKKIKILILPFEGINPTIVHQISQRLRGCCTFLLRRTHRKQHVIVETVWQGKLTRRLEKAAQQGAEYVLILSPEEIERDVIILRDMRTRTQQEIAINDLRDNEKIIKLFNIPVLP